MSPSPSGPHHPHPHPHFFLTLCSSPAYMSPECIVQEGSGPPHTASGPKSDVWSVGMILLEALLATNPLGDAARSCDPEDLCRAIIAFAKEPQTDATERGTRTFSDWMQISTINADFLRCVRQSLLFPPLVSRFFILFRPFFDHFSLFFRCFYAF